MENINIAKNIEMRAINTIKPYIRNPRKNDKTVDLLVEIIPKVGFNVPLVVDKNGVIVKGHSRFRAAIKLGMNEVPCIVTDADEETIKLDRLADNKISEFSEWVNDDLLHELDMLNVDFDLSSLGFQVPDFKEELEFEEQFDDEPETPEDARARYEQFLKDQEAKRAQMVQDGELPSEPVEMPEPAKMPVMATEDQIRRAEQKMEDLPAQPDKYYKVVCECCGHVMFVKAGDVREY